MPRDLHPDVITALDGDELKWIALIELHLDDVSIYLCTRLARISYAGNEYTGLGSISEIGEVEETMALDPSSCAVVLSGLNTLTLSTIANSDLLNRKMVVRYALLDDNNQIIGEPFVHFSGSMDQPEITFGSTSKIKINAKDELADWDRAQAERMTHEDQQEKYPGDYGLEFMADLANKEIVWPNKRFKG